MGVFRWCVESPRRIARINTPLSLSALSLDVVVVLSLRPQGASGGELARLTGAAPTSVQNTLRLLAGHGLVMRRSAMHVLSFDHAAVPDIAAVGLRLRAPRDAMSLILRASDAVEFACVDAAGFVIGTRVHPDPASSAAFEAALATIRRDRPDVPVVLRFETEELARILHSALGLRTRVASAEVIKGLVRRVGPLVIER
jgi:hypothetical protein